MEHWVQQPKFLLLFHSSKHSINMSRGHGIITTTKERNVERKDMLRDVEIEIEIEIETDTEGKARKKKGCVWVEEVEKSV
jgi:hypothetical protein